MLQSVMMISVTASALRAGPRQTLLRRRLTQTYPPSVTPQHLPRPSRSKRPLHDVPCQQVFDTDLFNRPGHRSVLVERTRRSMQTLGIAAAPYRPPELWALGHRGATSLVARWVRRRARRDHLPSAHVSARTTHGLSRCNSTPQTLRSGWQRSLGRRHKRPCRLGPNRCVTYCEMPR